MEGDQFQCYAELSIGLNMSTFDLDADKIILSRDGYSQYSPEFGYSNFLMVRIIQLSFATDHTGGGRGRAGREKGGGKEGGGRIGGGGKG